MNRREFFLRLVLYLFAFAAIAGMLISFLRLQEKFNIDTKQWVAVLSAVSLTVIIYGVTISVSSFLKRNPIPLNISLLGLPGSGKTVYLTSLFNELQCHPNDEIQFAPYGVETIEAVALNMNLLASGNWLQKTIPGTTFPYRARAMVRHSLFPRQFKVEIGDYAGEQMSELGPSIPTWLHTSEYFKYVVQSDAVIITLDTDKLMHSDGATRESIQNTYIAAFQVLAEQKGATESRRLRCPVALVFLKVDVLDKEFLTGSQTFSEELDRYAQRLIDVCSHRCRAFKVFYVSSVGSLKQDGFPDVEIHPFGVIRPLVWILGREFSGAPDS